MPTSSTPWPVSWPPSATTNLVIEIHLQLAAGRIALCDRYVASSYVLQRMDRVPIEYIEALNAAVIQDLAVILTADPGRDRP